MNFSINILKTDSCKETKHSLIDQRFSTLKSERKNYNRMLFPKNNLSNKINYVPYYSDVINRQYSHTPNHSFLIHEFVDNKKVTYKDITNKIDIDKLTSKIRNIIINTQRIKSTGKIRVNINKNLPKANKRKTKSNYSYRQTNSSFTTEYESKNSTNINSIYYRNKNNTNKKRTSKYCNTFSFNTNSKDIINKDKKDNLKKTLEIKLYENEKYDYKTLKEYLNEEIKTIQYKRYINETHISNNNDHAHNYSIDNEDQEIFDKNENILKEIDKLLILSNSKTKKRKSLQKSANVFINENIKNSKKTFEDKANNYNKKKTSDFLSYKKKHLNTTSKNSIKKNLSNTFKKSNANISLTKNQLKKNLNSNISYKKPNTTNYLNQNKLNKFLWPKPINTNIKKSKKSKISNLYKNNKSYFIFNNKDNLLENKENKNINNMYVINHIIESKQNKDLNEKNIKLMANNIKKNFKKRKNYSETIRKNIHSASHKKFKISNEK